MKKNKNVVTIKESKLNILVVILALIILTSLICMFAWAKYQSSLNGSVTQEIATWSFKVSDGINENNIIIDLASTRLEGDTTSIQSNYIGPRNKRYA